MKTNNILTLLDEFKIVIPPIQRDYAQGRNIGKIPYIREKFIQDIAEALLDDSKPTLELDFIYGYEEMDKNNEDEFKVFKPLDGQQRLTTLFLLHWYISVKEDKIEEARALLENFSYATRKSSRDFCDKLIQFSPRLNGNSIDEKISNQPWFFSSWLNDPTIKSMLVVLNSIEKVFRETENVWDKLSGENPRITFHLLSMADLGLPDDLYIKMNARGKSLTDFEHFKSQFSEMLDEDSAKYFNEKIDKEWSDLFWNIFKDKESDDIAKEVDSGFLSFFWFITDILIKKKNIKIESGFWLDNVRMVYKDHKENIGFLFNSIDLFENLEAEHNGYFQDIFYIEPSDFHRSKTRMFFNNPQANLFYKCVQTYGYGEKKNTFSVGEQLMLYAFIYMHSKNSFDSKKFRFLRNIFASSEDQLRNEYLGSFLYADIEMIVDDFHTVINENKFSENSKLSSRQCGEEKYKLDFLTENERFTETLFNLEDHHLLRGNISIFDFEDSIDKYASKFQQIFHSGCDYLSISKALLTIGDYGQQYSRLRRYGNRTNSTWRELLTQSESRKGFENTKNILRSYLQIFINNTNESNDNLVEKFLDKHKSSALPKTFVYYKVRHNSFTLWDDNQTNGYFHWNDYDYGHYDCSMLFRKQFNGRHWSPYLLELSSLNEKCSIENYGNPIQYTDGELIFLIENINEGFKFKSTDDISEKQLESLKLSGVLNADGILVITQDENGFDLEDRIIQCNNFLNTDW